jgi:hypothetical protein
LKADVTPELALLNGSDGMTRTCSILSPVPRACGFDCYFWNKAFQATKRADLPRDSSQQIAEMKLWRYPQLANPKYLRQLARRLFVAVLLCAFAQHENQYQWKQGHDLPCVDSKSFREETSRENAVFPRGSPSCPTWLTDLPPLPGLGLTTAVPSIAADLCLHIHRKPAAPAPLQDG